MPICIIHNLKNNKSLMFVGLFFPKKLTMYYENDSFHIIISSKCKIDLNN